MVRNRRRMLFCILAGASCLTTLSAAGSERTEAPLDPRGEVHIPIGIANTLDSLKTFVEAEGCFSPGVGTYGIYFWVYDNERRRLFAPTMEDVPCEHGLVKEGYLIPWAKWQAGGLQVRTELCHVRLDSRKERAHVVAARVTLRNRAGKQRRALLYAALRPLGPAGFDVTSLSVSDGGHALLVDGKPALVAMTPSRSAGVVESDTIGQFAMQGTLPRHVGACANAGDCSGALRFGVALTPGERKTFDFVCPVLPGRRAVRHQWDGVAEWAQFDLVKPNPATGGALQPDLGLTFYKGLDVEALFALGRAYWKDLVGRITLRLPDARWSQAFAAITGHAALAMNEGAPDVAVVNYNVFNRDGVYVANILQKAGRPDLAAEAIDYFLAHPFNGRSYPEADNPGQILWIMGEHMRFVGDRVWWERVGPAAEKLAAMIRYCRTTEGPYWVQMDALRFGDDVPQHKRRELKPGRCDGHNPSYTEAFDVAGLRAAARHGWGDEALVEKLLQAYDDAYGGNLPAGYGSYCVLWPCRLYPLGRGKAYEQFRDVGPQKPKNWRYFPLARAHQSLLAGNRAAGHQTLEYHLDHPQMRHWYAFDEGGMSGSGGWGHLRTTWDGNVAMPHGWAIAEFHLLLRDCLAFEDRQQLILFAGIPAPWFTNEGGMDIKDLPTHFGKLSVSWTRTDDGGVVELGDQAAPAMGYVLSLPASLKPNVTIDGAAVGEGPRGFWLKRGTKRAHIRFGVHK